LFDREQERKLLGLEDGELAVYFVGRLSEEKNPDVFVEAARRLLTAKRSHKLKFFVIGDGPMRGVIEKSIGGIKNGNIQYLGYKPTAEVARYLAGADIFVLPSAIEGFPLSLLEAMAMRVIPVASHVGAVPEVVDSGRNGYVISPPGSVDAIVDVLVHLDDDRNEVASIKELARNDVETKYSNKVLGKAYTNMYRRVL
jgi:glycosyltransferase involved in cell wall biosynthesis